MSSGKLGRGFGLPAVMGAKVRGYLQGCWMWLWLMGLAESGWLMVTLTKGGSVLSMKKKLRSATPATEETIERGNGWGGFRGLSTRRLSSEFWAPWLLGSSSGLVDMFGVARQQKR